MVLDYIVTVWETAEPEVYDSQVSLCPIVQPLIFWSG